MLIDIFTDGGSKVQLYELVGALKDSAKHGALKKQLNIVKKRKKIVSVPLPKHEKQKVCFLDKFRAIQNILVVWALVSLHLCSAVWLRHVLMVEELTLVLLNKEATPFSDF